MAGIPGIPQNFNIQTANQQNLVSWDLSPGATSYQIQRSLDNVTFVNLVTISGSPLATSYVDSAVTLGTQYWYRVAAAQVASVQATATLTFSGQPNPGDTISIANIVFTAVASAPIGNQFKIGVTLTGTSGTMANLTNIVNAVEPTIAIASNNGISVVTFTATSAGQEGNGLQFSNALTNVIGTPFSNGVDGIFSSYTLSQSAIPTPTGEMSLQQIRLQAMQRADRVNSNFLTIPEWNTNINKAMFELYDLLVTVYEDYFLAPPIQFVADGNTYLYPLPNGSNTFLNANNPSQIVTPPPYYKLLGVDLALQNATNAYVTINKFNFIDRNRFVYPNTASTIYGVFNLQYRVMGSNIEFIPTPSAGQNIRLWYIPRMTELLQDTDITQQGISGWIEYVIVRTAKYALDKEESDTTKLDQELNFLKTRIEETAANRDAGSPDTISDTQGNRGWGYGNGGFNGGHGGW